MEKRSCLRHASRSLFALRQDARDRVAITIEFKSSPRRDTGLSDNRTEHRHDMLDAIPYLIDRTLRLYEQTMSVPARTSTAKTRAIWHEKSRDGGCLVEST